MRAAVVVVEVAVLLVLAASAAVAESVLSDVGGLSTGRFVAYVAVVSSSLVLSFAAGVILWRHLLVHITLFRASRFLNRKGVRYRPEQANVVRVALELHYGAHVSVSEGEADALNEYIGLSYINARVRAGDVNFDEVWQLDALMAKYELPFTVLLQHNYRGPDLGGPMSAGTIIDFFGYVSTTLGARDSSRTRLIVIAPRGTSAIVVPGAYRASPLVLDSVGMIEVEQEVILPRGSRMVVLSDVEPSDVRLVTVVVLPPRRKTAGMPMRRLVAGSDGLGALAGPAVDSRGRPALVEEDLGDGDGWVCCEQGHRHWGPNGAAGLLLWDGDRVLLQQRAHWTDHGGTWGLPGGARRERESAAQAAQREAEEEDGIPASSYRITGNSIVDHGGWSYTTLIGYVTAEITTRRSNEALGTRWVPEGEVETLHLHPDFKATWDKLRRTRPSWSPPESPASIAEGDGAGIDGPTGFGSIQRADLFGETSADLEILLRAALNGGRPLVTVGEIAAQLVVSEQDVLAAARVSRRVFVEANGVAADPRLMIAPAGVNANDVTRFRGVLNLHTMRIVRTIMSPAYFFDSGAVLLHRADGWYVATVYGAVSVDGAPVEGIARVDYGAELVVDGERHFLWTDSSVRYSAFVARATAVVWRWSSAAGLVVGMTAALLLGHGFLVAAVAAGLAVVVTLLVYLIVHMDDRIWAEELYEDFDRDLRLAGLWRSRSVRLVVGVVVGLGGVALGAMLASAVVGALPVGGVGMAVAWRPGQIRGREPGNVRSEATHLRPSPLQVWRAWNRDAVAMWFGGRGLGWVSLVGGRVLVGALAAMRDAWRALSTAVRGVSVWVWSVASGIRSSEDWRTGWRLLLRVAVVAGAVFGGGANLAAGGGVVPMATRGVVIAVVVVAGLLGMAWHFSARAPPRVGWVVRGFITLVVAAGVLVLGASAAQAEALTGGGFVGQGVSIAGAVGGALVSVAQLGAIVAGGSLSGWGGRRAAAGLAWELVEDVSAADRAVLARVLPEVTVVRDGVGSERAVIVVSAQDLAWRVAAEGHDPGVVRRLVRASVPGGTFVTDAVLMEAERHVAAGRLVPRWVDRLFASPTAAPSTGAANGIAAELVGARSQWAASSGDRTVSAEQRQHWAEWLDSARDSNALADVIKEELLLDDEIDDVRRFFMDALRVAVDLLRDDAGVVVHRLAEAGVDPVLGLVDSPDQSARPDGWHVHVRDEVEFFRLVVQARVAPEQELSEVVGAHVAALAVTLLPNERARGIRRVEPSFLAGRTLADVARRVVDQPAGVVHLLDAFTWTRSAAVAALADRPGLQLLVALHGKLFVRDLTRLVLRTDARARSGVVPTRLARIHTHLVGLLPPRPNQNVKEYATEVATAHRHAVPRAMWGTPEAVELVHLWSARTAGFFKMVVGVDGVAWIIPAALVASDGTEPVKFSHAYAAGGWAVQAGFTVRLAVAGETIQVGWARSWTGHYHKGFRDDLNWDAIALLQLALEEHSTAVRPRVWPEDSSQLRPPNPVCPDCVVAVGGSQRFCTQCGTNLMETPAPTDQRPTSGWAGSAPRTSTGNRARAEPVTLLFAAPVVVGLFAPLVGGIGPAVGMAVAVAVALLGICGVAWGIAALVRLSHAPGRSQALGDHGEMLLLSRRQVELFNATESTSHASGDVQELPQRSLTGDLVGDRGGAELLEALVRGVSVDGPTYGAVEAREAFDDVAADLDRILRRPWQWRRNGPLHGSSRRARVWAAQQVAAAYDRYRGRGFSDEQLAEVLAERAGELAAVADRIGLTGVRADGLLLPAAYLEYWGAMTRRYRASGDEQGLPAADVGRRVRALATERFTLLMPRALADELVGHPGRRGRTLPEIVDHLDGVRAATPSRVKTLVKIVVVIATIVAVFIVGRSRAYADYSAPGGVGRSANTAGPAWFETALHNIITAVADPDGGLGGVTDLLGNVSTATTVVGIVVALVVGGTIVLVHRVGPRRVGALFSHVGRVAQRAALAAAAERAGHPAKTAEALRAVLIDALNSFGRNGVFGWLARSWLERTAEGRGVVARGVRVVHALRLDRPVRTTGALPLRPVRAGTLAAATVASGLLMGAAGAVVVGGAEAVVVIAGGAAASVGVGLALQLLRWSRQARAPTAAATPASGRLHISGGLVVAGLVVAVAGGVGLVLVGGDVVSAVRSAAPPRLGQRIVATLLISSVLTYHSVLRKHSYELVQKGVQHRVRVNAIWSAVWSGLFGVGVMLIVPVVLATRPGWVTVGIGVLTTLVSSLIVRKSMGWDRVYGAVVGAAYAVLTVSANHALGIYFPAPDLGTYVLDLLYIVGVAAPGVVVVALAESEIGKRGVTRAKRQWRDRTADPSITELRDLARRYQEHQRIKRINTHAELLKLDAVVNVALVYVLVRSSVEFWILVPITMATLVAFLYGRDKLALRYGMVAETGGRVQRRPVRYREGLGGWRLHLPAAADNLLAVFRQMRAALRGLTTGPDIDLEQLAELAAALIVGEAWERLERDRPGPGAAPAQLRLRLMEDARAINHVLFVLAGLQLGELDQYARIKQLLRSLDVSQLAEDVQVVASFVAALRGALRHAAARLLIAVETGEIAGVTLTGIREGLSAELRPALELPRVGPAGAGTQHQRYSRLRVELRVAMFAARRDAAQLRLQQLERRGARRDEIEHAEKQLLRAQTDLDVEIQRVVDPDPLNEMTRGFGDRGGSVRRRYPSGVQLRAGAAVQDVLEAYGIALTEARRYRADVQLRRQWVEAMTAVAEASAGAVGGEHVLTMLLALAAEPHPVRRAGLERNFGARSVELLVEAELVVLDEATGTARAGEELRRLWRYAPPVLRALLRRAPDQVPDPLVSGTDGSHLRVLLVPDASRLSVDQLRDGGDALLDVLRVGAFVARRDKDGLLDDVLIAGRIPSRLREQMRDGDGRLRRDGDLELGSDISTLQDEFLVARDELTSAIKNAVRVRLLRLRTLRADGPARERARSGLLRGPPVHDWAIAAAADAEVAAFAQLEAARKAFELAAKAAGVAPHKYAELLRRVDTVQQHRPGTDPPSGSARELLLESRREMRVARHDLALEKVGSAHAVRDALQRHRRAEAAAWSAQLHRSMGGWHLLRKAEDQARELAAALHALPAWSPALHRPFPVVHPHVVPRGAQDGSDRIAEGPVSAAVRTENGGDPTNHDAATIGLTRSGLWFAINADSNASGSGSPAQAIVAAAREALLNKANAGAPPREVVAAAMRAAAAEATRQGRTLPLGSTARTMPPGASVSVVVLEPNMGLGAYSSVGSGRIFRADPGRQAVAVGKEDRNEGGLTHWFAADRQPDFALYTLHGVAPGTALLLISDGAWRDLAEANNTTLDLQPGQASQIVDGLFATLHTTLPTGLRDDATIAAIVVDAAAAAGGVTVRSSATPASRRLASTSPLPQRRSPGSRRQASAAGLIGAGPAAESDGFGGPWQSVVAGWAALPPVVQAVAVAVAAVAGWALLRFLKRQNAPPVSMSRADRSGPLDALLDALGVAPNADPTRGGIHSSGRSRVSRAAVVRVTGRVGAVLAAAGVLVVMLFGGAASGSTEHVLQRPGLHQFHHVQESAPNPVPVTLIPQSADRPVGLAALFGVPEPVFAADNPALVAAGWHAALTPNEPVTVYVRKFRGFVTVQPGDNIDYYARLFNHPTFRSVVELNPRRFGPGSDPDLIHPKEQIRVLAVTPDRLPEPPKPPKPPEKTPGDTPETTPGDAPEKTRDSAVPAPASAPGLARALLVAIGGLVALLAAWELLLQRVGLLVAAGRAAALVRPLRSTLDDLVRRGWATVRGGAAWLVGRVGWDVPMPPGAARLATAVAASALIGSGAGGWSGVSDSVAVAVSSAFVVAGAALGVRVWWSTVNSRPDGDRRLPSAMQLLTVSLGGIGGVALGWLLPRIGPGTALAVREFVAGTPATAKLMVAALVSSFLIYRVVLHRQTANREVKGWFTRPVQDALISAAAFTLVVETYNVLRLQLAPDGLHGAVAPLLVSGMAAVSGVLSFAVQRRIVGRERVVQAVLSGLAAIPPALVAALQAVTSQPAGWPDYLTSLAYWSVVVAIATPVTEWTAALVGRLGAWTSGVQYRRAVESAMTSRVSRRAGARITAIGHRLAGYVSFGVPDGRVVLLKSLTPVLVVVLTYVIVRPLPGVSETLENVALRVFAAVGGVAILWAVLDRLDMAAESLGHLNPRGVTSRRRPPLPVARLARRAAQYGRALAAFRRDVLGNGTNRPHQLLYPDLAKAVTTDAVALLSGPGPSTADRLLDGLPIPAVLDHQVARARELEAAMETKAGQAVEKILQMLAADVPLLRRVAAASRGRTRAALQFQRQGLESLGHLAAADENGATAEARFIELLRQYNELRSAFLSELLSLLKHLLMDLSHAEEGHAPTVIGIAAAQAEIQQVRPVPGRGVVAARLFLRGRRHDLRVEHAAELPMARIAALGLVESWVALHDEALWKDRRFWKSQIREAVGGPAVLPADSPLAVALFLMGRNGPVTADEVMAHVGIAGFDAPAALEMLASAGFVRRGSSTGYVAEPAVREPWVASELRLRHALARNPLLLPGGTALTPLTAVGADTGPASAVELRQAHIAFVAMLTVAERFVFHWRAPGLRDDIAALGRRAMNIGYQRRHPDSRIDVSAAMSKDAVDEKPRSQQMVVDELKAALAGVRDTRQRWRRVQFIAYRERGGRHAHDADANAPPPRSDDEDAASPAEVADAEAAQARDQALTHLAELAARVRKDDFPTVGARPRRISSLLEHADKELLMPPGGTSPAQDVRRAARDIAVAERRLRAVLAGGSDAELEKAAQQAHIAVFALERAVKRAGSTQTSNQFWPRRLLIGAERRAMRILDELPDHLRERHVFAAFDTEAAPGDLALRTNDQSQPDGFLVRDADETEVAVGASNPRLSGTRRTADSFAVHIHRGTGALTVVVTDGVGISPRAGVGSAAAARAGAEVHSRAGVVDGPQAEKLHRKAVIAAAAEVRGSVIPGELDPPRTTYRSVRVDGPVVTTAGVGDTNVYIISPAGEVVSLGEVPAAKRAAWLGADSPDMTATYAEAVLAPGELVLVVTDGFYKHVTPARVAEVVRGNPTATLSDLVQSLVADLYLEPSASADFTVVVVRPVQSPTVMPDSASTTRESDTGRAKGSAEGLQSGVLALLMALPVVAVVLLGPVVASWVIIAATLVAIVWAAHGLRGRLKGAGSAHGPPHGASEGLFAGDSELRQQTTGGGRIEDRSAGTGTTQARSGRVVRLSGLGVDTGRADAGDALAAAVEGSPVDRAASLEPAKLVDLGAQVGVENPVLEAAGATPLVAHKRLIDKVADTAADLVIYVTADALHADRRVVAALRRMAETRADVVRMILVNALTRLQHPEWDEVRVQAVAPLPAEWPDELLAEFPMAAVVEALGIPAAAQQAFQALADQHRYVIDVRPANPFSIALALQGALRKSRELKAKTITVLDVLLGADPSYLGAVGYFRPRMPSRDEVSPQVWDALEERFERRAEEYADQAELMAVFAKRPLDEGRLVRGGQGDSVVFGFDEGGRRVPVAGDVDVFDVRRRNGRRLSDAELKTFVAKMIAQAPGVRHGPHMYRPPSDPTGWKDYERIIAAHQPDGEPLVRFAPKRLPRLVDATTPVLSVFASLKLPGFRMYAASQVVAMVGYWVGVMAQDLLVLDLSGNSASALGIVVALQFGPYMFGLVAGVFIERADKRGVLIATNIGAVVIAVLLALLTFTDSVGLGLLYALSLLTGLVSVVNATAQDAFVPGLVGKDHHDNAAGLLGLARQLSKFVGSAIAAGMVGGVGSGGLFLASAAMTGLVAVMLLRVPREADRGAAQNGTPDTVLEGLKAVPGDMLEALRHVWRTPALLGTILTVGLVTMFGLNWFVKVPLLVSNGFGAGSEWQGLLTSALGIGAVAGLMWLMRASPATTVTVAWWGLGVGIAGAMSGVMPTPVLAAGMLAVAGALETRFMIPVAPLLARTADPGVRTRVMGLFKTVSFGTIPVSSALLGPVGDAFGGKAPMVMGGAVAAGAVLIMLWLLGRLGIGDGLIRPVRRAAVAVVRWMTRLFDRNGPPSRGLAAVGDGVRSGGGLWQQVSSSPMFGPMKKNRACQLYLLGFLGSTLAVDTLFNMLVWLLLERQGALTAGLAVTLFSAGFVLAWKSGVWADRFDTRRMVISTQSVLGLLALLLPVMLEVSNSVVFLPLLYASVFGGLQAIAVPAWMSWLPGLVTGHDPLSKAIALRNLLAGVIAVLGSLMAGVLLATAGVGVLAAAVPALVFGLVVLTLSFIKKRAAPVIRPDDASTHLRARPEVVGVLTLVGFLSTFAMAMSVKLPLLATVEFGDVAAAGVLLGALQIGHFLGDAWAWWGARSPGVRVVAGVALAYSVLVAVAGMMPSLELAAFLLVGSGVFQALFWTTVESALLQAAGPEMSGRAMGANSLLTRVGGGVGGLVVGWAADAHLADGRAPLWVGGLAGVLGVWAWWRYRLRSAAIAGRVARGGAVLPKAGRAVWTGLRRAGIPRVRTLVKVVVATVSAVAVLALGGSRAGADPSAAAGGLRMGGDSAGEAWTGWAGGWAASVPSESGPAVVADGPMMVSARGPPGGEWPTSLLVSAAAVGVVVAALAVALRYGGGARLREAVAGVRRSTRAVPLPAATPNSRHAPRDSDAGRAMPSNGSQGSPEGLHSGPLAWFMAVPVVAALVLGPVVTSWMIVVVMLVAIVWAVHGLRGRLKGAGSATGLTKLRAVLRGLAPVADTAAWLRSWKPVLRLAAGYVGARFDRARSDIRAGVDLALDIVVGEGQIRWMLSSWAAASRFQVGRVWRRTTSAVTAGGSGSLAVLRLPNVGMYVTGQAMAEIAGLWVPLTTINVLILQVTDGDLLAVGVSGTLFYLSAVLVGIPGGYLADRMDHRHLIQIIDAALMVGLLVLGSFVMSALVELWMLYVASLLHGVFRFLAAPARPMFVDELIGPNKAVRVLARNLQGMIVQLAKVVGAAGAGWLIYAFGAGPALLIAAAMLVGELATLQAVHATTRSLPSSRERVPYREVLDAIRNNRDLRVLFAVVPLVIALADLMPVPLALFALDGLAAGPDGYGVVKAAVAAGWLVGAVLSTIRPQPPRLRVLLVRALAWVVLTAAVSWLMPTVVWAAGALFVTAIFAQCVLTAMGNVVHDTSPLEVRGRVTALFSTLTLVAVAVTSVFYGWLADQWGGRAPLVVGGVTGAFVVVAALGSLNVPPAVARVLRRLGVIILGGVTVVGGAAAAVAVVAVGGFAAAVMTAVVGLPFAKLAWSLWVRGPPWLWVVARAGLVGALVVGVLLLTPGVANAAGSGVVTDLVAGLAGWLVLGTGLVVVGGWVGIPVLGSAAGVLAMWATRYRRADADMDHARAPAAALVKRLVPVTVAPPAPSGRPIRDGFRPDADRRVAPLPVGDSDLGVQRGGRLRRGESPGVGVSRAARRDGRGLPASSAVDRMIDELPAPMRAPVTAQVGRLKVVLPT